MSNDNNKENIYSFEGEDLVEVEYDDVNIPEDDDDSTAWTDVIDNDEEIIDDYNNLDTIEEETEPAIDLSVATFTGHSSSVYAVEIHSKIPGLIISGGGDDKAFIWKFGDESKEGFVTSEVKCLCELSGHTDSVTCVGFNFDGTLALTGSYDGTVRIWNVEDGLLRHILEGPEDIDWAEWHSKGNAVIAGSKDGTVWMWLANNGQCVQVFSGHDGEVSSGCFSKDGKTICTGGEDGTVRIWAPKSGVCKHTFSGLHGHEGTVTCLESSEDGDMLLSGSVDGKVRLFQISGKKLLHTFVHSIQTINKDNVPLIQKSSNDQLPYLSGDIDEDILDDNNFIQSNEIDMALSVECIGFGPIVNDRRYIASGGMDKTLKIWDLTTGTLRLQCLHEDSVVSLKFHKNLPLIITASLDFNIRIWDIRNGNLLKVLTGHNNLILNLDIKPLLYDSIDQTDVIATVSDDCTAKIFFINANELLNQNINS